MGLNLIYGSPPLTDDAAVWGIANERWAVAKTRCKGRGNPKVDFSVPSAARYSDYLSFQERMLGQSITSATHLFASVGEATMIEENTWAGVQKFNAMLDDLQSRLRRSVKKNTLVHVDLGESLSGLYLAYFATLEGLPLTIAFHDAKAETFGIGGFTGYAKIRPYLRRHLIWRVLRRADKIFIPGELIGGALTTLFPRLDLEMFLDPIIGGPNALKQDKPERKLRALPSIPES